MKATKIISACAVLVALASCSNDHVISQPGAEDTPIRIQANVGAVTTKAASDIQGSQFDANETIGIFLREHLETGESNVASYSNPITGTVNASNTAKIDLGTTQYFPPNGHTVDCLAIYPMQINTSNIDHNTHTFSVEEDQSDKDKYKASDLMYAYKAKTAKKTDILLTFTHLLSKIIVEVVADESVNNSVLNDVYIDLLNTCKTVSISVGDMLQGTAPSQDVSVTVTNNSATIQKTINLGHPSVVSEIPTKTKEVAGIIVPQQINSGTSFIKVRLNNNSGTGADYATYTYAPSSNVTFEGSKSYKYTITIKAGSISVSNVTINNWDDKTTDLPDNGNGDANLD